MVLLRLIATVLLTSLLASGQGRTDSLLTALKKASPRDRVMIYLTLSDDYSNSDLGKAMDYARRSMAGAERLGNDTLRAMACNSMANVYQYKSALDSALTYHRRALAIRRSLKDSIGVADSHNNIGIVYDTQGLYKEALQHYFKALAIYDRKEATEKRAMTYTNIGIIYKAQKEYGKALGYYRKAYELYRGLGQEFGTTIAAGNLGSILITFGRWKESLAYSEQAIAGYRKMGYERYVAYPLANVAIVYDSLHQFPKANATYREALGLHTRHENWYEVANTCNALANCLNKQGNERESIAYAKEALAAAQKADAYSLMVDAEQQLARAYKALGDFRQALLHAERYAVGKDSLFRAEKTRSIIEMEARYQNVEKEKQLLQQQTQARRRNAQLLILAIIAAASIAIGWLIYRQQRLRNKQQQQEFRLKTAIAEIETQNRLQQQRLSISRDLHDNIGAQLTFIISSVDNLKYAFKVENDTLIAKLRNISDFAQSTITELRDTIWAMHTEAIGLQDLKLRILNFIEKARVAAEHTEFRFSTDESLGDLRFGSVTGMNLYRVIQEAVNNSLKYASATEISVEVKDQGDEVLFRISDNGKGFDEASVTKGNGLRNMRKRMKEAGASILVSSQPGQGTVVSITLPKPIHQNQPT